MSIPFSNLPFCVNRVAETRGGSRGTFRWLNIPWICSQNTLNFGIFIRIDRSFPKRSFNPFQIEQVQRFWQKKNHQNSKISLSYIRKTRNPSSIPNVKWLSVLNLFYTRNMYPLRGYSQVLTHNAWDQSDRCQYALLFVFVTT